MKAVRKQVLRLLDVAACHASNGDNIPLVTVARLLGTPSSALSLAKDRFEAAALLRDGWSPGESVDVCPEERP